MRFYINIQEFYSRNVVNHKIFILLIGLAFLPSLLISDAYAYLDPTSGMVVLQAVVGALIGVGIAIKIYWLKIVEKFGRLRKV